MKQYNMLAGVSFSVLLSVAGHGFAADNPPQNNLAQSAAVNADPNAPARTEIIVNGKRTDGSAEAGYRTKDVQLGPLGGRLLEDTPYTITTIPGDLLNNQQVKNISDVIKYDPSAQIEPRGSLDFGRPQSRGFENSVTQNTRVDGMNTYSIMAYPMEAYDNMEVLNGAAGALYGASSPGGTFNFILKRPTDHTASGTDVRL